MENEAFFLCECSTEALLLTRFVGDMDKEIYLSIYSYGQYRKKPGLLQRLKYCWHHLKTGKKYEDQIILSFDKAKEIADWLIKNTNK
jgi:hypothetical protein